MPVAISHRPKPLYSRTLGLSSRRLRLKRERESAFWQLLDRRGLNLTQVAARAAISHSYASRIVAGTRCPSLNTTMDLAAVLGVSLQEMADILVPPETRLPHDAPAPRLMEVPHHG